jgi:hypothetical protein
MPVAKESGGGGAVKPWPWILLVACALSPRGARADDDFKVLSPGSAVRGHLWVGDGLANLWSAGTDYLGNRFRVGAEIHLGEDYRYLLGITLVDEIASGESAPVVGDLSRNGLTLDAGYFVVPDRWWVKYSFLFADVHGDQVLGFYRAHGHGVSVGYRFWEKGKTNLSAELGYLYVQPRTISLFETATGAPAGDAHFPAANVLSLSVRLGLDLGGR